MLIFLWLLAFAGVALIYLVPYIGGKVGLSQNLNAGLKLLGIIISVVSLLMLNHIGGFN